MHVNRRLTAALGACAALALAGGAYAATQSASSTSRQAFLNDLAKRLNVTPAQLSSALRGAYGDRLNALVAAGRLTKAQAKAIEQAIARGGAAPLGALGLGPAGAPGANGGGVFRPLGRGSFRGAPPAVAPRLRPGGGAQSPLPAPAFGFAFGLGFGPFGGGSVVKAAESYLGLSGAKLGDELRAGKSLAAIATAQGKTASGLEGAIVAAIRADLDKAVAAKRLTSAQEAKILARATATVKRVISATPRKLAMPAWHATRVRPGVRMFRKLRGGFWALPHGPAGGPGPKSGPGSGSGSKSGSGSGSKSGSGSGSSSAKARKAAALVPGPGGWPDGGPAAAPGPPAPSPAPPPSA
jgi:hypothetical protein